MFGIGCAVSAVAFIAIIISFAATSASSYALLFAGAQFDLFANAMNYGFFAGILRILWSCVRTILRVAVSVGVIILGVMIYFFILGFITANPQKDDAQLNIDKMDEQIQKLQERHEVLQRRFDEEQMNIQNINRIGSRLEQLQQIKPEEIIPLLIEAGKYY